VISSNYSPQIKHFYLDFQVLKASETDNVDGRSTVLIECRFG